VPEPAPPRRDAVSILSIYLVLLFGIPSRLIVGPLGASGSPAAIFGLGALLWWSSARMVRQLGVARGLQPVRIAIGLLAGAVVISYVVASIHVTGAVEARGADRGLLNLMSWSGIAFVAADGIRSWDRLMVLLRRVVAGATCLAGAAVIEGSTHIALASMIRLPGLTTNSDVSHFLEARGSFHRAAATATHPIELGVVLALALPIALHFAVTERRARWKVAAAVIVLGAAMTVSRSAIIGLGVGFVIVAVTWPRHRQLRALALLPAALLSLQIMAPAFLQEFGHLFTQFASDASINGRTSDYSVVARYVSSAPVAGRGFGTFSATRYRVLDNQYLGTAIEVGILGLLALILLFAVAIFTARGARRRSLDVGRRDIAQGLAASATVAMVLFATFDAFSFPMASGMTFLVVGVIGAAWRLSRGEPAGIAPPEAVGAVAALVPARLQPTPS
jgi:O-antigen ligase